MVKNFILGGLWIICGAGVVYAGGEFEPYQTVENGIAVVDWSVPEEFALSGSEVADIISSALEVVPGYRVIPRGDVAATAAATGVTPDRLDRVFGLAHDAGGELAAAAYGAWVYEGQWGARGSGNGEFYYPIGVEISDNGNVYVADQLNHRVQYFTSTGSFLGKWGSRGSGNGQFTSASGVAVASSGNVYVSDETICRVQFFTSTGSFLGKWGSRGSGNGEFENPRGVAVSRDGNVYVADTGNYRIQYFTPTGSFLGKWGAYGAGNGNFNRPMRFALNPTGSRLYVVDSYNHRI